MKEIKPKLRKYLDWLGIGVLIGIFFTTKLGLMHYSSIQAPEAEVFGFVADISTICGLLTESQVMILVCLVVLFEKRGFIVGMILSSLTVLQYLSPLLWGGSIITVIGMIMIMGAGLICAIIYQYGRSVNREKQRFHHLSSYDELTQLANRRMLMQNLKECTQHKHAEPFSLVFIDLDDFKKVNDFAGHHQGDALLQEVVKRWNQTVREQDLLCRLGGDEFALMIHGKLTQQELLIYIDEMRKGLKESIVMSGKQFPVSASFGIASFPEDADSYQDLLKYADTAMYTVKGQGKDGRAFFSDEMYQQLLRRQAVDDGLRQAIQNNEMYLMYQPQYHCHPKKLRGFEVLLRWESPTLGFVSPGEFIPIAEENGYIISIGNWVMEQACRRFMTFTNGNPDHLILSVNVSAMQFLETNFMQTVKEIIQKTGIDPTWLEFEITESIFISSKEYVIKLLNQLRELGIHIALDDFGTQYASLSYIQMLPLDVLKIDKSFIDVISSKDPKMNLVTAIIDIAQQLNYKVVAEGVEKEEQLQYLEANSCDYIQGYLWGKPMKEEAVQQLITGAPFQYEN